MINGALPASVRDLALLLARVILGVVLFAHGWQKLIVNGIAQTHTQFETLGIPLAIASASFVTLVEFVGGVLLMLGVLTPVVALLHLVVMIGAASFVHVSNGIFAADGGWELVGVIAVCELMLATWGAGRLSVDHLVATRRAATPAESGRHAESSAASRPAAAPEVADVEPVTSALPVQTAAPMFTDTSTSIFDEQSAERPRRMPRAVAPLHGREAAPRRREARPAEARPDVRDAEAQNADARTAEVRTSAARTAEVRTRDARAAEARSAGVGRTGRSDDEG